MNQRDVLARGAKGEQLVAEILGDLSPELGYAVVNDILLDFKGKTSQIDHVLIDRFGILVIETKMSAARLKGKSQDREWTACYASGQTHQMFNPLFQNEGHRKWLHKVLTQNSRDLPENYVQSLIVFADGKIDALELSDTDSMRVVSKSGLPAFIRARYDFQPNVGQLGTEAQQDLYEFVVASNRREDPEVWARHLASCKRMQDKRSRPAQSQPARSRPTTSRPPSNVIPLRPGQPRSAQRPYSGGRVERQQLTVRQVVGFGVAIVLVATMAASCATAGLETYTPTNRTAAQPTVYP